MTSAFKLPKSVAVPSKLTSTFFKITIYCSKLFNAGCFEQFWKQSEKIYERNTEKTKNFVKANYIKIIQVSSYIFFIEIKKSWSLLIFRYTLMHVKSFIGLVN